MEGKNACWVPGTDHASIATEAKVVNKLAAQGIKKTDLTRDEFSETCLGLDRRTWRHHPEAAPQAGCILRLGSYSFHYGRETQ